MEDRIAKVTSTMLGIEDHGIMTAMLQLDYGDGGAQGAGGYTFDLPKGGKRVGTAFGIEWIMGAMGACGVRTWEEIKGRTVIAHVEDGAVVGLSPLPTERGKKFMFKPLAEAHRERTT